MYSASKEYNQKVESFLAGGHHYNFASNWNKHPLYLKSGQDSRLTNIDGKEYLDFYCKSGSAIFGHNHPEFIEQFRSLTSNFIVDNNSIDFEVGRKLVKYIPCSDLVRFGLSGTEIVQNAIRLARAYTGKNKFIRFQGHYHGNVDNIMGGKFADLRNPIPIEFPDDCRGTEGRANNIFSSQSFLLPWNDIKALEFVVDKYADEICSIILEPICINGGGFMPQSGFLEAIRKLCDNKNIVLFFDEIITGFRVGIGGAQKLLNNRGRTASYPTAPSQIPACGFPAQGSS